MSRSRQQGSKDLPGEVPEDPLPVPAAAPDVDLEQQPELPDLDLGTGASGSRATGSGHILEPRDAVPANASGLRSAAAPKGPSNDFLQSLGCYTVCMDPDGADDRPSQPSSVPLAITDAPPKSDRVLEKKLRLLDIATVDFSEDEDDRRRDQSIEVFSDSDLAVPEVRIIPPREELATVTEGRRESTQSSALLAGSEAFGDDDNRPGRARISDSVRVHELEDDEEMEEEQLAVNEDEEEEEEDSVFSSEGSYAPNEAWGSGDYDDEEFEDDDGFGQEPVAANIVVDEFAGMVKINTKSMLSFMCFAVLWAFSAAALLLALTWHYVWVEVKGQADLAAEAAVEAGSLHASEVLSPYTSVMKVLDLGFRGGIIANMGDYDGFKLALQPLFQALPSLRDVEMADTPEYLPYVSPGSVLATRLPDGIEMRSDRGDCSNVPGGRGCVLEPQRANGSSWFEERKPFYPHPWNPLPMFMAWHGPSYARDLPHESICDEMCWSPTYSLASRISGGTDPYFVPNNKTFDPFLSVIVRITMEATVFVDVLKSIQMQSQGEALICTEKGVVVASVDMADAQIAVPSSGTIRMVKVWEFPRDWSAEITERRLAEADGISTLTGAGDYLVSVWPLDSPHKHTASLQDALKIVVAIPLRSFSDSVVQSLRLWFIGASALPVLFFLLATLGNIYLRYLRKNSKQIKDMSIDELKALTRKKKEALRKKRAKERAEKDKVAKAVSGEGQLKRSKSTFGRITDIFKSDSKKSIGGGGAGWLKRTLTSFSLGSPKHKKSAAAIADRSDSKDSDALEDYSSENEGQVQVFRR